MSLLAADLNWGQVGLTTGVFVTSIIGIVNLLRGFGQDKNSNVQQAIELALRGNKDLIGDLRSEVSRYRDETKDCHERCDDLEIEVADLKVKLATSNERVSLLERRKEILEAENIRLHVRLGDIS